MLRIQINKQKSAKFFQVMATAPEKVSKATGIALRRCGDQLRNDATKLVRYKTGHLRGSIEMQVYGDKKVIVGTDLIYGPIHEFGGTIKAKNKPYLTFKVGGRWVRVKSVKITPKPYLTPAFEKLAKGDAQKIFNEELLRAIS